jgi:GT2 family glycosyltransferase
MNITASIVLYNSSKQIVNDLINKINFFNSEIIIFLVDNSPNDSLKILQSSDKIKYIHLKNNIGFGAAHNIAITESINLGSLYHFIINPDIVIKNDIFNPMINYLNTNKFVGIIMPQILNIDGSIQYLPKLIPSPFSILKRKIHLFLNLNSNFLSNYELRFYQLNETIDVPIVSGCFMLLNVALIKKNGLFDHNFFMYFEDWDLSRRINSIYKTIYMPTVQVYHHYESGANKNINLFFIYLTSGIKYFNKWGWFFDKDRNEINKKTLNQFKC